ncbi:hypothetical protein STEG23_008515 [Scotinomys teguina]
MARQQGEETPACHEEDKMWKLLIHSHRAARERDEEESIGGKKCYKDSESQEGFFWLRWPLWLRDMYRPLHDTRKRNMAQDLQDKESSGEEEIFSKSIPRVLSEFSKAQVNSVPSSGPSQETETSTLQTPLSLSSLASSTHLRFEEPAELAPARTSSGTSNDGHKHQLLPQETPDVQQLGTAQASPTGSTSDQQPSSPLDGTAGQGSGQPMALEYDRVGPKLVVSSPTSPILKYTEYTEISSENTPFHMDQIVNFVV